MTRFAFRATALLAAAALSSPAAFAGGEFDPLRADALPDASSARTRAEVKAEAVAAARQGVPAWHGDLYGYAPLAPATASTLTRAEVRAEVRTALQAPRAVRAASGS